MREGKRTQRRAYLRSRNHSPGGEKALNDSGRLALGRQPRLGRLKRGWIGRARLCAPEFGGRHARVSLEGVGEMALIVEAGGGGDLRQRSLRVAQLPHAFVQAQLADVLADRAAIMSPKHAGQVGRMHPGYLPELLEADVLAEVCV